jgi:NAD(P)-dependent dehydrogenase (short-subunit alcohol dehydrogenase family)
MTDLDGLGYRDTTVVVVGCANGIGAATARVLGDLGARVHAVSLHEPAVDHVAFHPTDLSNLDDVARTAAALAEVGPVDHLFCASGIPVTRDSLQVLRVNYVGVRQMVEQALPSLRDGAGIAIVSSNVGHGWEERVPVLLEIIEISDPAQAMAWFEAHPDVVADGYRLSKHLLDAWIARAAPALASAHRIRINCTAPGVTDTALVEETRSYVPDGFFESYPYPLLGRSATAEEQAWSLVLLNSPLNASVTGTTIYCDQGVTLGTLTGGLTRHR